MILAQTNKLTAKYRPELQALAPGVAMIYGVFLISLENSNRLIEIANMHLNNETCFDISGKKVYINTSLSPV